MTYFHWWLIGLVLFIIVGIGFESGSGVILFVMSVWTLTILGLARFQRTGRL